MSVVNAITKSSHEFGIVLKEKQRECLEVFCTGRDVFAILPTGYGKSIIYYLAPKVIDLIKGQPGSIILVISPLVSRGRNTTCKPQHVHDLLFVTGHKISHVNRT